MTIDGVEGALGGGRFMGRRFGRRHCLVSIDAGLVVATSLITGMTSGAMQSAASSRSGPMDIYVDTLLRRDSPAADNAANAGGAETRRELVMPILLWLLGIPIPLIILIMLLHH